MSSEAEAVGIFSLDYDEGSLAVSVLEAYWNSWMSRLYLLSG